MRQFTTVVQFSDDEFLRDVGITREQFLEVRARVASFLEEERTRRPMTTRGKQTSRLPLEDRLLLVFTYLRHYPTFQQLGQQFGISESYAHKLYERYRGYLVHLVRLPQRHALLAPGLTALLLDATEQPIERPIHRQRASYSGKKKRHTINAQLLVGVFSLQILAVVCGQGRTHDFTLFKQAHLPIAPQIEVSADSGYQGIEKVHSNSQIPIKKPKGRELTAEERTYNRALARVRIAIEHVNRRCKIFRIVKETYRGKHKHIGLTWHLIAGLVNLRYA
ncbi:transposase, IS4 family protein [Candidatus Moduliflexus flocculans]|uniref:Transposase, IS4 family protein n=1 Tax=Candidatus Moduliflexus flocculans TaxID=1499966 RepID=A0A0S6VT88_9BACT|nr:transposase, IS4 family protein [Candidatus Moduliflexus flocculans]